MLLTVTSNPTLERTLFVPRLEIGAVHRTSSVRLAAGGKGLNVARSAGILGHKSLSTAPLAGHSGRLVAELASQEGLDARWYWLGAGETRASILLLHEGADTTVINEAGSKITPEDWSGWAEHVCRLAREASAVALSSSFPPGVEPQEVVALCRALANQGRIVYLDTSGAALAAVLRAPPGICIKVNAHEFLDAWGTDGDLLTIARSVLDRGAVAVVITLGAEGALCLTPEGGWKASAPQVEVKSSVGSGDALLAGLATSRLKEESWATALRRGVACGSANATADQPAHFNETLVFALESKVSIQRLGSL